MLVVVRLVKCFPLLMVELKCSYVLQIIDTQETDVGSSQNSSEISFALNDLLPEFQLGDTVQMIDSIEPSVTSRKNVSIEVIDVSAYIQIYFNWIQ